MQSSTTQSSEQIIKSKQQSIEAELNAIIKQIGQKNLGMAQGELQTLMKQKNIDHMLGCLFGSFIGDSLGSYCQFQQKASSLKNVDTAMKMVGQGPFRLLPGQITDDSQMALHMLQALLLYNKNQDLESQAQLLLVGISKQYIQWLKNLPFDIGYTCRNAIQILKRFLKPEQKSPTKLQTCKQQYVSLKLAFGEIAKRNHNSLSNGFLMRISPLVCFSSLILKYKNIKQESRGLYHLVKQEVNMTHSNLTCISANVSFIQFVTTIINRTEHSQLSNLKKQLQQKIKNKQKIKLQAHDLAVFQFLNQAYQDYLFNTQNNDKIKMLTAACQQAGYFRIAYYYTFYSFFQIIDNCKTEQDLKPQVFKKAMKFVIEQGGDTDTNACIAGTLIGSIFGFSRLPKQYLVKMLRLRLGKSKYRINEKFYEPINGFINLIKLYKKFV